MTESKSNIFLIGRIDKQGRRIVFVNEPARPPFPGPWDLQAVFTVRCEQVMRRGGRLAAEQMGSPAASAQSHSRNRGDVSRRHLYHRIAESLQSADQTTPARLVHDVLIRASLQPSAPRVCVT